MKKNKEKILKSLIEIPSPSGYEGKLANYIRKTLLDYMPRTKVEIDFHNNVIAKIEGKSDKVVMIDAHLDQLGFLVSNVDKDGYISLIPIGGYDLTILRGRRVLVLSSNNRAIEGVIGTKHAHLIPYGEEKEQLPDKTTDLTVDIGVRRRKQVLKYLSIGDPVIIKPSFSQLVEEYYTGDGFDDKAGCYILMETLKEIRRTRKKPIPTLIFTFSCQEELGCKGAKELVRRYNPDLFIGLDVTFATDSYEVEERETGRCNLGNGIVMYKGVNIHKPSLKLLQSMAKYGKIKVQYQATNGGEGTNADTVANEVSGIRVINLGIPLRHMHSPVEVINIKDLNYGIKLLKSFLLSRKLEKAVEK